ncbi:hypothetical protein ACQ4M3_33920 [Leptolyngbya sp. AN03gr2]|uniref:hypothetical protein n=1 Tax=unclassified Leptolyngbya TaxID=2650499 RepID=UPI003D321B1B
MTLETAHRIGTVQDLTQPLELANRLVGETCWQASFSYGDELNLHFGERIPYSHPKLVGQSKGSWILGSRGTNWQLESPLGILITSEASREEMEAEVKKIEGSTVTKLEIGFPQLDLILSFDHQLCLKILPTSEDDEYNLAYWELFTPDHHLLEVRPRMTWVYKSSVKSEEKVAQN